VTIRGGAGFPLSRGFWPAGGERDGLVVARLEFLDLSDFGNAEVVLDPEDAGAQRAVLDHDAGVDDQARRWSPR
jgi:hypothetical protein